MNNVIKKHKIGDLVLVIGQPKFYRRNYIGRIFKVIGFIDPERIGVQGYYDGMKTFLSLSNNQVIKVG